MSTPRITGAIGVALIMVLLGSARAEAAEVSTGPVRIMSGDDIVCLVANTGGTNMTNVLVFINFRNVNGAPNDTIPRSCGTLTPGETCGVDTFGIGTDYAAFCEITFPGGKIRGTLCNVTRGLCSDAS